jgi:hypothetical protein
MERGEDGLLAYLSLERQPGHRGSGRGFATGTQVRPDQGMYDSEASHPAKQRRSIHNEDPAQTRKPHSASKAQRWAIAILSSSPRLARGGQLCVGRKATMRHPTSFQHQYRWTKCSEDRIQGSLTTDYRLNPANFEMQQEPDGIHWRVGRTTDATEAMQADI